MTVSATPQPNMPPRLICGLVGVLLAVMVASMTDQITAQALADIKGYLGIGTRLGSWAATLFYIGAAMGMLVAMWLAITFSLRWFSVFSTCLLGLVSVLLALTHNAELFLALRFVHGLSNGFLIPLLLAAGLRFLTPQLKLMGLAAYGLSATFAPNFATPLVAWAHQVLGYEALYVMLQPVLAISVAMIIYGIPQDPQHFDRFKQFDWRGLLLGWGLTTCIIIVATQGERLGWNHSPLIIILSLASVLLLPAFIYNECYHPMPFIWPKLLLRPNFGFATLMLFSFIILSFSVSKFPAQFLMGVHNYRPEQLIPTSLLLALPPLVLLPLMAFTLNQKWADARWFMVTGLLMMVVVCALFSQISPVWIRQNFYLGLTIAVFGQAMVVVSLLKLGTSVIESHEGPYASATINTTRALAAPIGTGFFDWFQRHRTDINSHSMLDRIGEQRFELAQSAPLSGHDGTPFLPNANGSSVSTFASQIHGQSQVLTFVDSWQILLIFALALMASCIITQRVYPPRLNIPPET